MISHDELRDIIARKLARLAIVEVTPIPEDHDPADDFTDERDVTKVRSWIDSGNPWGWCVARVRAEYRGVHHDEFLGGCAYPSERAFKRGGYWTGMRQAAILGLADKIAEQIDHASEIATALGLKVTP